MSEAVLQDGDVLVRRHGALRRITLNRPHALNAVTLAMVQTMTGFLRSWADDAEVGAVLIDGAGERGFCAGGDLRALYDAARSGDALPARFWANEYRLNVRIARYPKPVVAIMDGVVMGGGVGLSAHASHRVVTERSMIAMPEVGIGFFPDVGMSFLLARSPGYAGTHLAMTGDRIRAADAIYCGLADIHIDAAALAEIPAVLADCHTADEVGIGLDHLSGVPAPGRLAAARAWIDHCYAADNVADTIGRLGQLESGLGEDARTAMLQASPTSLKVALRNIRAAISFDTVKQSFQQDYRIALACIAGHDFIEGVRATIVDKDRKPAWRPPTLDAVSAEIVDRHFRSVDDLELTFAD